MATRSTLSNADIAELLAVESESAAMPAKKALRRASRRALMWPVEAAELINQGRSLTELQSVGPYIATQIRRWLDRRSPPPKPPDIRRQFLTITTAKSALKKNP